MKTLLFILVLITLSTGYAGAQPSPLDPSEALKALQSPQDLTIELVLSEPRIEQPVFLNFDHRGRMWVVEYRQYPHPAGLEIVSTDQYFRNVYDKVPPAPPHHFRGKDRISIHEDTNGDGIFDKSKVFVDELNMATSVTVGRGGVWVLQPPYLLFYPDANGDDIPDGDPITHLKGFWLEDTHSIANSLRWGPDGWLYGCQGSTVSSDIEVVGKTDGKPLHSLGQLIWRYHPTERRFEIWAEGGGNAFGLEIDRKGRIFSGHNGGDTRGFHYPQHGYLRKGFTKHGPLRNPYAFGFFPHMPHNKVARFTHNFVIYEGVALPKRYHGQLFGVDPMNKNVPISKFNADGATFRTEDISHAMTSDDPWFRPVDIKHGPDGAIYVCDWYDQQLTHTTNHRGNVDRQRGRIYRIKAPDAKSVRVDDFTAKTNEALIASLRDENRWHRESAKRVIGDRRDVGIAKTLKVGFDSAQGQFALESLWAINLSGGFDDDFALQALNHADPHVRTWAIRLLGDRKELARPLAYVLERLVEDEHHVEVRSQLASSTRRFDAARALPIVAGLLRHEEDATDRYMPLLNWWALESHCESNPGDVMQIFEAADIWGSRLVREHILERLMRRFAATNRRQDYLRCARLLQLAPDASSKSRLLKGIEAAWSGRIPSGIPDELADAMSAAGGGSLRLRVRQKHAQALVEALEVVADPQADPLERTDLITLLGEANHEPVVDGLLGIIANDDEDERVVAAAITSLGSFDSEKVPDALLTRLGSLAKVPQRVALTVLVSRTHWAERLIEEIRSERIDRLDVPLQVIRQAAMHNNKSLRSTIAKLYGKIDGTNSDEMNQRLRELKDVVSALKGSPYDGEPLFNEHCGKCHQLFGAGGGVGPDLTSYQRKDVDRMLKNIVNPSLEIREGFENYTVYTVDGRITSGLLIDKDNNIVVLRGADGQTQNIPRSTIEEMTVNSRSLMPEGLLDSLSIEQIQHLFAYLRSSQPLNN